MNSELFHPADEKGGHRAKADESHQHQAHGGAHAMGSYARFSAMVLASTALGFGVTYLNTYQVDHVFFSWTRVFMAMIMGGVMATVMMLFMWGMYPNKRANRAVVGVAACLALAGLALVRSQATVGDVAYMEAMIPHHSIAILTSSRARIEDPRVRKLADGIIETQKKEIAEMKSLISELDDRSS